MSSVVFKENQNTPTEDAMHVMMEMQVNPKDVLKTTFEKFMAENSKDLSVMRS
jgi:hypothetical protein